MAPSREGPGPVSTGGTQWQKTHFWNDIAQAACTAAGQVQCSAEEYRDGLRYVIDELRTAVKASEEMGRG